MAKKGFDFYNRIAAAAAFIISTLTYLLTVEPTASFWDCGEFIASSYKLEVGHPPGNPVFQLAARFFTIFADKTHVALAVNCLSAICSSLTILLLYLTIVFFAKRLYGNDRSGKEDMAIILSGLTGSLAFCFSDTFWFSAVEAEVYAMSSLFTALVFWCMTRWYEEYGKAHADRWIVLICFLMGLSIGVHLLNLLSIPAIVFMYFYRLRESGRYKVKELVGIFMLSCIILAIFLFILIPYLPKAAAYADLFFVNILGLPFNSGAAFFMLLLLGGCFIGLFHTLRKGKVAANTVLLCVTTVIIGFSIFSIVIIRSSVKTPTNEYQPDNPFTLVRYLSREQYGSNPLIYGEYFDAPYDMERGKYHTPVGDRYLLADGLPEPVFRKEGKMLFPRMWDSRHESYIDFYMSYIGDDGIKIKGADHPKPTFTQNMMYFLDYQINWMYWRYFLWNFAGRQNDLHGQIPGDTLKGNWECGIGFIDRLHLGDQSGAPAHLADNKSKNHYYMLPLLLGIIGLFFQYSRDKRGCWLVFLMFFMTGIAIVVYLNQPPYQVRERDYAYAGSFYFFSLWIGLGAAALARRSFILPVLSLGVPALMAVENWDDHNRSGRRTTVELARNYLESTGENGILVTHGDNDTFILWYAQEVEGIRPDVRIVNTSLLGTDWHYDQMKYAVNKSAPLDLSVSLPQYLYGTNELIYIYDTHDMAYPLSDVMRVFRHPEARVALQDGTYADYIPSRRFTIPVNKENVMKYGILDEKFADIIPESIELRIPESRNYITKQDLFFMDLLSNYEWDRPISFLGAGGDISCGIKDYLMFDGLSYRFVPIKNATDISRCGFSDPDDLYRRFTETYRWDELKKTGWHVDYQNIYTFTGGIPVRKQFLLASRELLEAGMPDKAVELLDLCQECVPEENFPLDLSAYEVGNELYLSMIIDTYYEAGAHEKAREIAERLSDSLLSSAEFYIRQDIWGDSAFNTCYNALSYIAGTAFKHGDKDLADSIEQRFNSHFL